MRAVLIDALEKQYEAELAAADALIKLLLEKSVAISDHINIQKELRASADESYGKFGSAAKKSGKINR